MLCYKRLYGRRAFLKLSGVAAVGSCLEPLVATARPVGSAGEPTQVLRICKASLELAPGRFTSTTTFNGQLPGPLLRGDVGQLMRVDIYNETDSPQRVNWHGQRVQGGGWIPPHGRQQVRLVPVRPGLFFYHSGEIAAGRLDSGMYSGLVGGLLVGSALRQQVVVLKECEPFLHRTARGYDVGYKSVTASGRSGGVSAGAGELLHVLNGSATRSHTVELPGHSFEVLTLDGFPVASPATVANLHLAPAERVLARVTTARASSAWDYSLFAAGTAEEPDARLELVLSRHAAARSGFNSWSINGSCFSVGDSRPLLRLKRGLRYRLAIRNISDEAVPLHLQHHVLRLVGLNGRPDAGVMKDVICVAPRQLAEVDFVADNPGRSLLYCTRQLQRDFGLMALVEYA